MAHGLAEAVQIRFLTAGNAIFTRTAGHMLSLDFEEQQYPVVYLHCSFPHTNNRDYISVRTQENKEIGMIRRLDDFPGDTVALLEAQIRLRYFAPLITKVLKITEEFGYGYWEAETSSGPCRFTVRTVKGTVKAVTPERILVTDVNGNRFIIENIAVLSLKEQQMVEFYL